MRIGIFTTFRNTVVPFNGQMYKTTLTCIRFTNLISALSNNLKILGFNYFSQITYLITLFEVTMKKYHSDTVWQKSVQNMHVETSNANCYCLLLKDIHHWNNIFKQESGVVLQFCVKKQRNKALFSKNKALLRIKVWVNFIFIFQNLLLNHFYCMIFSRWVLVFPLMICFII